MSINFFAIVEGQDGERLVQRIRVNRQLQDELAGIFEAQAAAFVRDDFERVDFDPRHSAAKDEVHVLHDFELPEEIASAIDHPNQPDDLHLRRTTNLKALFAVDRQRRQAYFQGFSRSRLLVGGPTLLIQRDTYQKVDDPGLILDTKLSAVYDDGDLLFRSYAIVNRFLDLTEFYRDATDSDIREVLAHRIFHRPDADQIIGVADTVVRKKFTILRETGVLETVSVEKVRRRAKKYEIECCTKRVNGRTAIVLPGNRRDLKYLLDFLTECVFEGELTGQKFVSHSHRPWKSPA